MNPIPFRENSRVAALCTFFDSFVEGSTQGLIDYQNALSHGGLKGATAQELEEIAQEFGDTVKSGGRTLSQFAEFAKALDVAEVDECYQNFLEKIDFCQNMDELIEFFRDFKLYGAESMFKREGKYEGVCLTTVHSAKGLEWDVTYLSLSKFDKEDYHRMSTRYSTNGEKSEVNRKWFVGATRAREELVMTGEYVVKFTNRECILNDYVRQAYDILGRPYGYSAGAYWETVDAEKREALEQAVGLSKLRSAKKMQSDDIIPSRRETVSPTGRDILALYSDRRPAAEPRQTRNVEDLSITDIEFV